MGRAIRNYNRIKKHYLTITDSIENVILKSIL